MAALLTRAARFYARLVQNAFVSMFYKNELSFFTALDSINLIDIK